MTPTEALLAFAAVAVAASVQGAIGFGLALIAAPVLALIDVRFVPGPLTAAAMTLMFVQTYRERAFVDGRNVAWAIAGAIVGAGPALVAMRAIDASTFGILFGVLVLCGVALSLAGGRVALTPRNLFVAGIASGFMGTTSAIGGPPIALVYQHEPAAKLRGTLPAYFAVACVLGLILWRLAGRFGADEIHRAVVLLPGLLVGYACSRWSRRLLDGRATRPLVLALSSAAAMAVLVRALR